MRREGPNKSTIILSLYICNPDSKYEKECYGLLRIKLYILGLEGLKNIFKVMQMSYVNLSRGFNSRINSEWKKVSFEIK